MNNPVDAGVLPDQQLDVTVVFSEPMDTTSVTVTAGNASPYNDITASDAGLDWSWTNCPEEPEYKDTWHGVFEDLSGLSGGRITVSILASDQDANGLMDPSIPCSDGTDYNDTHHSFSLMGVQPGWPVSLSENCYGSPTIADLDGDGDLDIALMCDDGNVYLLDDDGSTLNENWPEVISDWSSYGMLLQSSPALADLDGDGDLDLIAFLLCGCGAEAVADGSNISGWPVYPGTTGGHSAEFPGQSSPVLADMDGDGHLEVLITRHLSPPWTNLEHTVFMYDHTGSEVWSRNLQYSTGGASVISTPAVGDIDGDGNLEIVVCTAEGYQWGKSPLWGESAVYLLDPSDGSNIWKTGFDAWFAASSVIADIDGDGIMEIIAGTEHSVGSDRRHLFVLDGLDGSVEFSVYLGAGVQYSAAVGDLNDDGYLDFVVPCNNGYIYAWSGEDYTSLPSFPVHIGETPGAPALADIDSDPEIEIVFGTGAGNLWALNSDGTTCSGYPIAVGGDIRACPAAGDIDGDGHLEIVMVDADNAAVYCLDLGAGTFPALLPWRQFQHDSWHTGCFEADNTIPAPPTNLQVEQTDDVSMVLAWDLSVNDPYSSTPEEPADVISYQIFRGYPPHTLPSLIGRVQAGTDTYTDTYDPMGYPMVEYCLTASDGTNESGPSNIVRVRIEAADILSIGCPVAEVFREGRVPSVRPADASSMDRSEGIVEGIGSAASIHTAPESVPVSTGNAGCLTDGSLEEVYTPSPGVAAVVIDLGEECSVTSVIPRSEVTDHCDIAGVAAASNTPQHSLMIEVAGTDRRFESFNEGIRSASEGIRYIRIHGASGLAEVSVYGSRPSADSEALSLDVVRSLDSDSWSFSVPLEMLEARDSGELSVKIFDMTGRLVWSGRTEVGSELHWDGLSNGGPVPSGVYLLQCSIGSEVSTGSFVVRRDR